MPRDAGETLTLLTRIGFAARGLLYLVIAWLVVSAGRAADTSAAMRYLSEGAGKPLMLVMIAGFLAYGFWRLSDAAFNIERHPADRKGAGQRFAAAASGTIYVFFACQAIRLLQGAAARANTNQAEESASTALHLPGGTWLLFAGAAILAGVGVAQLVNAWRCKFCRHLHPGVQHAGWVRAIGRGGYLARGIVFLISAFFLLQAGLQSRASEAGGMEEAIRWLDRPWDMVVAAGLGLFGLFSLIEARYRVIHDVPVDRLADKAREHLPI